MVLRISLEDPAQKEIINLLEDDEKHSAGLYPAESNHHLPLDALREAHVRFLVGRNDDSRAVATGALVLFGNWAELKRMWVVPEMRGRGISRAMLELMETNAREAGVRWLRLETGVENHAALALYQRAGFTRCDPFGDYRPDPLSVFMQKQLAFR
jgi:putative acetyltransferase